MCMTTTREDDDYEGENVELVCKLHFPEESRLVCPCYENRLVWPSDALIPDGLFLVEEKKVPDGEALESLLQQRNSLRFLL